MQRFTDWLWEHVVFHIVCKKDEDYNRTHGGRVRDNRFCKWVTNRWNS